VGRKDETRRIPRRANFMQRCRHVGGQPARCRAMAIPDALLLVGTGFVTLLVALSRSQRARAARNAGGAQTR
jgi:hypothetical protein